MERVKVSISSRQPSELQKEQYKMIKALAVLRRFVQLGRELYLLDDNQSYTAVAIRKLEYERAGLEKRIRERYKRRRLQILATRK